MASALNSPIKPKALAYRADIDGLRGIAVLLVMAYHFNIPQISGGYIGVDIFFVISGCLITSLLCLETATFASLNNFYRRRIKRLLPMFLVIVVVTTIVAAIFMLPDDFLNYLRSVYHALIFRANVYFDGATKNYFAANARELPLLHVWSLSIEWQFYFIFPIIFLFARKWLPYRALVTVVTVMVVALAFISWRQTGNSQEAYFYTSARFFELLIGCLCALVKVELSPKVRNSLVYCVTVSLIGIAFVFDNKTVFPGINAAVVCVLTALAVMWGRGNRLLELRGMVHTGKISYSAYLWHWPVVAFFRICKFPYLLRRESRW